MASATASLSQAVSSALASITSEARHDEALAERVALWKDRFRDRGECKRHVAVKLLGDTPTLPVVCNMCVLEADQPFVRSCKVLFAPFSLSTFSPRVAEAVHFQWLTLLPKTSRGSGLLQARSSPFPLSYPRFSVARCHAGRCHHGLAEPSVPGACADHRVPGRQPPPGRCVRAVGQARAHAEEAGGTAGGSDCRSSRASGPQAIPGGCCDG